MTDTSQTSFRENLTDAGCCEESIRLCESLRREGKTAELLKFLTGAEKTAARRSSQGTKTNRLSGLSGLQSKERNAFERATKRRFWQVLTGKRLVCRAKKLNGRFAGGRVRKGRRRGVGSARTDGAAKNGIKKEKVIRAGAGIGRKGKRNLNIPSRRADERGRMEEKEQKSAGISARFPARRVL